MRREVHEVWSPAIGASGMVMVYGHWGRPLLVFASEMGRAFDFENNGMVEVVTDLIEGGRVKLYCIDSFDASSWSRKDVHLEHRAVEHGRFEDYVVNQIVPFIHSDCGGPIDITTVGCSMGAFHAANFALKRADMFPSAICMSGIYDIASMGWGERGDAMYFSNPSDYVANMDGDHLEWLRSRVWLLLVCGQGQWEDTTGALDSTKAFSALLSAKGIRHELDLWGHDVPHDWPSWRAQFSYHLRRLS